MEYNSWKVQVIADSSGAWAENAMRYATEEAATEAAKSLARRWTLVLKWRVVESEDMPND
jgi:hypothetical protein